METAQDVRPSPIAGQWYAADPVQLAASVDKFIQNASLPEYEGQVIAIMTPHAGHIYSGAVAGHAFAAVQGLTPELVVVVSPMHHPYPNALLTTAHEAYHTPLGNIPVDRQIIQELDAILRKALGFGLTYVRNDPEHSLEIELPFLQRALPAGFKLLPVMVRDQSQRVTQALGIALAQVLGGRSALLVASTDLSHFYPQHMAELLDQEVLRRVEAFDPPGVLRVEDEGKGFACGRGALAAVLWAAQELGATRAKVVRHATSGDVTGDFSQVVGYAAAVITRM